MPTKTTISPPFGASMPSAHHTQYHQSDLIQTPFLKANSSTASCESRRSSSETQQSPSRAPPFYSFQAHHHYGSTSSTSGAGSSTSSPMTSSSLPEQTHNVDSPSTSPDTPSSSLSYNHLSQSPQPERVGSDTKSGFRFAPSPTSSKRQKNPKNLALNTAGGPTARALSSANLPLQNTIDSQPQNIPNGDPSPFFKPEPPRRKSIALGLTLKTPSNSDTFGGAAQIPQIPPTPGALNPPVFRRFSSTPHLPLQAVEEKPLDAICGQQFASPIKETFGEDEVDPYDLPESREQKPEAYPNGPICIYDPHVDLYFEPTAQEASDYDVIVNVASEVRNPFLGQDTALFTVTGLRGAVAALQGRQRPFIAGEPTTSTIEQGIRKKSKSTEYIHIPWEHNSNIVPGSGNIPPLNDIIRVIDDRVSSGKRVLIHCQCGVSRSASLIVAYGIYKNPSMTVQEAYDKVKERSSWIGPNMNFIMQLQDYRNILLGSQLDRNGQRSRSRVLHGRLNSDDPTATVFSVPQTAPLPTDCPPKKTPSPILVDSNSAVSPGPSSAPSDFRWPLSEKNENRSPKPVMVPIYPETTLVNPLGPMTASGNNPNRLDTIMSIDIAEGRSGRTNALIEERLLASQAPSELVDHVKSEEFAMTPAIPAIDDPSFGITSPRESSFANSSASLNAFSLTPPQKPRPFPSLAPLTPPEDDPSLGLFSPRSTDFPPNLAHFIQTQPSVNHFRASEQSGFHSVDQPRLSFGNHRSMFDLRGEREKSLALSQKGRWPGTPPLIGHAPPPTQPDLDELMSPRATEFSSNPFHDAFAPAPIARLQPAAPAPALVPPPAAASHGAQTRADPRSPAQKGSAPVVRNIMDVFESGST